MQAAAEYSLMLMRLLRSFWYSVRGRLMLYFFTLSLVLIAVMTVILLNQGNLILNKSTYNQLQHLAELHSIYFENLLRQQQQQLQWAAETTALKQAISTEEWEEMQQILNHSSQNFTSASAQLQLILKKYPETPVSANHIMAFLLPTDSIFTHSQFIVQLPYLYQTMPVYQEQEIVAVLAVRINGELLARNLSLSFPKTHFHLQQNLPESVNFINEKIYRTKDAKKGELLSSWHPFMQNRLLLSVSIPVEAIPYLSLNIIIIGIAITLVILILIMLFSYRLIERLISPLSDLMNVARHIGNGQFSQHFQHSQLKEFDQLGVVLNQMSNRLQQMVHDLEQQVQERTILSQAYERFVPRQFLKLLDKNSITEVKLGDQIEKEMTILFSDIRDFTQLSEMLTPQDNFDFINSYLSAMEPVIYQHSGVIDKYIGDAIMALFPGSADDAVQAAIDMIKCLQKFNAQLIQQDKPAIKIGIGLNTGELMLGIVGGENRMDGTVIADVVNLASRVEDLTKIYGSSLLITTETYLKLAAPQHYHIRLIDAVQVKGKSQTVTVYEVYDADAPDVVALKDETREDFEVAIMIYENDDFEEARVLFHDVLTRNPADQVAKIYLDRCNESLSALMPAMPTVLIVDDTPFALTTLSELLSNNGYQVLTADNGLDALQLIESHRPHLILLDVMMPEVDGFEVCRRLQLQAHTRQIPIIFITALSETGSKVKGFQVGGVDYITKPFEVEEVLARIKTHVSIRHLCQQLEQKNRTLELDRKELLERLRLYKTERKISF
ncbi:response regulator [Thioflexithrix psekupsensis]|uniref:Adenylate/guanylate cyclase domain-containing response regulator n=1 Tax=Thioflexithrix psekupsensis TaxID=1570016 RepID=A0A251X9J8_9GAMM|nr:response regulator [Thioflexithrix psekupsensis]OUD14474.1 hypothetical protein TPSD3_09235 [Thioflexithrix psekupsensis]